jgi:hypothetical protein
VDLDGDGLVDLAVADFGADEMWAFHGNGDGTFAAGETTPCGTTRELAVADVTDDGRLDLISTNGGDGSSVTVLPNLGALHFGTVIATQVESFPIAVAAGDFNGDGRPDVAVGDLTTSDLTVELGAGNGTFTAPITFPTVGIYEIIVGDLNSDGKPDLVFLPSFGQSVYVVLAH